MEVDSRSQMPRIDEPNEHGHCSGGINVGVCPEIFRGHVILSSESEAWAMFVCGCYETFESVCA